jgi:hypothetical protein
VAKKTPAEIVVEKLRDQEVLKNYCTFAGLHRARAAVTLFDSLGTDENQRRSIGLEIFANFAAALEDVALWFFVLREWKKGKELLFDLLDRINVTERPGHAYSSERALDEMARWTIADLRREFGLPADEDLLKKGWTERMLNDHINGLRGALELLRSGLEMRSEDEHGVVSAYNKLKHGALAVASAEHSPIGVSVMLASRRGPRDPASGRRKINVGWIACEDEALRRLVDITLQTSSALWAILNLLYMTRFDAKWRAPHWPYAIGQTQ